MSFKIPIYCIVGLAYGAVETIRRVIPKDIVGSDVTKLLRMDSFGKQNWLAITYVLSRRYLCTDSYSRSAHMLRVGWYNGSLVDLACFHPQFGKQHVLRHHALFSRCSGCHLALYHSSSLVRSTASETSRKSPNVSWTSSPIPSFRLSSVTGCESGRYLPALIANMHWQGMQRTHHLRRQNSGGCAYQLCARSQNRVRLTQVSLASCGIQSGYLLPSICREQHRSHDCSQISR